MHQQQHDMYLEKTHPSGAEEWACSMCRRRFILQWPPTYKKIVLEAGDEEALHFGGKGGLSIGRTTVVPPKDPGTGEDNLEIWQEGLRDIDLDV